MVLGTVVGFSFVVVVGYIVEESSSNDLRFYFVEMVG